MFRVVTFIRSHEHFVTEHASIVEAVNVLVSRRFNEPGPGFHHSIIDADGHIVPGIEGFVKTVKEEAIRTLAACEFFEACRKNESVTAETPEGETDTAEEEPVLPYPTAAIEFIRSIELEEEPVELQTGSEPVPGEAIPPKLANPDRIATFYGYGSYIGNTREGKLIRTTKTRLYFSMVGAEIGFYRETGLEIGRRYYHSGWELRGIELNHFNREFPGICNLKG